MSDTTRPIVSMVYNSSVHVVTARLPLIAALKEAGYEVAVISPVDAATPELIKQGVSHHPIAMDQYGMNPIREIRCMRQIEAILRRINPAVSLHYTIKPNTFGALAAQRAGIPVINNIAGAGRAFSSGNPVLRRLVIGLYRRALRHSSKVFFQNSDDMRLFLNAGMAPLHAAERIPGSGVDLHRFRPTQLPAEPIKMLFIGRLLREKGIGEFLAATQLLVKRDSSRSIEFHILGEHQPSKLYVDRTHLDEAVRRRGVFYNGIVPADEIAGWIASAHCVVLPSYYGEGVPRVLLEACASGRPIITTDNVGCRDVVEDGVNGFMIRPRDAEALARSIAQFCDLDTSARENMGRAARATAERRFDERIVIKAYLDAISELVERNRRAAV